MIHGLVASGVAADGLAANALLIGVQVTFRARGGMPWRADRRRLATQQWSLWLKRAIVLFGIGAAFCVVDLTRAACAPYSAAQGQWCGIWAGAGVAARQTF